MAGNVTGLHVFAADVGPEALSLLDGNFSPLATAFNTLANFSNYYVDSGAVNALVVTTVGAQVFSYVDGVVLDINVANTTTSATPTINVNGLGTRTIVNADGTALIAGALAATGRYRFIYDGANWRAQTIPGFVTGTFTATGVGFTAPPTATATYVKFGPIAYLRIPVAQMSGTSNSTSFSISGLPAVIQPATITFQEVPVYAIDNGSAIAGVTAAVGSGAPTGSGTITLIKLGVTTGFTASGSKGSGFVITYLLI